jgi:hypothetical protein
MLRFNDGVTIDTSGPPRKLCLSDGLYIVGNGMCCPVDSDDEADQLLSTLRGDVCEPR